MLHKQFSLDKVNYEALRRQRRRKMLLRSAAPAAIVFIIAVWFLAPTLLTHKAIGEYKNDGFKSARSWLNPLTWTSPEQFVIAFNSGTVDTQLGRYHLAEAELTRALAIAPADKRCMVAQNLVASLKAHADSLKSNPTEAKVYTTRADNVIKANQICFKGSAAQGGGGGGSASSGANAQSQSPNEAQQQQLQQKEQEGRERQEQFAREEEFNPDDPKIKPW